MTKILNLPKPTDQDGKEYTLEELDAVALEPYNVPIQVTANGKLITCHVACDFDNVSREADKNYQLFKARQAGELSAPDKAKKNSKFTNIPEEEDDINSYLRIVERSFDPATQRVFLDLAFPPKYQTDPVILGHNVPGMPQSGIKEWMEKGGRLASSILEEIVIAYDPFGLTAAMKKATKAVAAGMVQASQEAEKALDQMESPNQNSDSGTESETPLPQPRESESQGTETATRPESEFTDEEAPVQLGDLPKPAYQRPAKRF